MTKTRIIKILAENRVQTEQDIARCRSYIATLIVFEVEIFCGLHEWKHVLQVVRVSFLPIDANQINTCMRFRILQRVRRFVWVPGSRLQISWYVHRPLRSSDRSDSETRSRQWVEPDCPVDGLSFTQSTSVILTFCQFYSQRSR